MWRKFFTRETHVRSCKHMWISCVPHEPTCGHLCFSCGLLSLRITLTCGKNMWNGTTHEIHMWISCDFSVRDGIGMHSTNFTHSTILLIQLILFTLLILLFCSFYSFDYSAHSSHSTHSTHRPSQTGLVGYFHHSMCPSGFEEVHGGKRRVFKLIV